MAVLPVCSAVQLGHAVGARRRLLGGDCRARARLAPSHRPHPLDRRRARGQGWHCVAEQGTDAVPSSGGGQSLLRVAVSVGTVTSLCKVVGMAREMLLAAHFGVGPIVDAFNYASIVPGFFISTIGGINGPCHTAVASALGRKSPQEARLLTEAISTLVGSVLLVVSVAVFFFAASLIDIAAPGLAQTSPLTREMAIKQLQCMAPCTLFAGLIGTAFGSLSNAGIFLVPSLSPAFSSLAIIGALLLCGHAFPSHVVLAAGFTAGALLQLTVQASTMARARLAAPLKLRWLAVRENAGLREILRVLLPATVVSGVLQIAMYVDLYFASFMPGAAAGLGYANLLAMAPIGIVSSSILVPILPRFAHLSQPETWPQLCVEIRKAVTIAFVLGVALVALFVPLADPIVRLVFQRQSFDPTAGIFVASLFRCCLFGAPIYLVRDVAVRVFYVLGEGKSPFWISVAAIAGNVVMDWLCVTHLGLGAPGLVIATVLVNALSLALLLVMLGRKLPQLQLHRLLPAGLAICGSGGVSAALSNTVYTKAGPCILSYLNATLALCFPPGAQKLVAWATEASVLGVAAGVGLAVFCVVVWAFKIVDLQAKEI